MKGVVLVELLAMAEGVLGEEGVDDALDACPLSTGGAFSRVGNYPCSDLVAIAEEVGRRAGVPPAELQRRFGHWMLAHFGRTHPDLFEGRRDAFAMLEAIDAEVHVEVRKLYPEAELPRFETERLGPRRLRMTYRSPRPLAAFCRGLIEACLIRFGAAGRVEDLGPAPGDPRSAVFDVILAP